MIAFIVICGVICSLIYHGFNNLKEDSRAIAASLERHEDVYLDHNWRLKDMRTHKYVYYERLGLDRIMRDFKTKDIIRNVSEEERINSFTDEEPFSYQPPYIKTVESTTQTRGLGRGVQVKDKATQRIFIIRHINFFNSVEQKLYSAAYYMDAETLELVRLADYHINVRHVSDEEDCLLRNYWNCTYRTDVAKKFDII